ncbi:hypothetical protein [Paenibacillus naphthalenovorans]|uniref:Uncharacterized protein n=1 Tax=Paenibacillus naphthalenovorans TaxID=162209 RepID=A0A0U2VFE0_9BACL|nr:hypothetical protein [Paenibacillus naphthalenovorans]ALS22243.1 hypothetical protein IJ22_18690 [Paenibacillus naphthalenovorans]
MTAEELKNKIVYAFRYLDKGEQLRLTKQAIVVKDFLRNSYGEAELTSMMNLPSETWKAAWKLFEEYHGIFTHGDYLEATK